MGDGALEADRVSADRVLADRVLGDRVLAAECPLAEFVQRHGGPCPAGRDRFDWSAQALDDLARLVAAVAPAAEKVSGRPSQAIARQVEDLVTAIVAHRNSLL